MADSPLIRYILSADVPITEELARQAMQPTSSSCWASDLSSAAAKQRIKTKAKKAARAFKTFDREFGHHDMSEKN